MRRWETNFFIALAAWFKQLRYLFCIYSCYPAFASHVVSLSRMICRCNYPRGFPDISFAFWWTSNQQIVVAVCTRLILSQKSSQSVCQNYVLLKLFLALLITSFRWLYCYICCRIIVAINWIAGWLPHVPRTDRIPTNVSQSSALFVVLINDCPNRFGEITATVLLSVSVIPSPFSLSYLLISFPKTGIEVREISTGRTRQNSCRCYAFKKLNDILLIPLALYRAINHRLIFLDHSPQEISGKQPSNFASLREWATWHKLFSHAPSKHPCSHSQVYAILPVVEIVQDFLPNLKNTFLRIEES